MKLLPVDQEAKFTFLVVFDHFYPLIALQTVYLISSKIERKVEQRVSYAISMGILLKRPLEKLFTQFDHFHDWYRLLQTGFQFKTELNLNLNFITGFEPRFDEMYIVRVRLKSNNYLFSMQRYFNC